MESSELKATIVIATHNREAQLRQTLMSLNEQELCGDFEVIVVDDGSAFNVSKLIETIKPRYTWRCFAQARDGVRAARARNLAIRNACGEVIIFLDDDMVTPSGFLQAHLKLHACNLGLAVIGLRRRIPHRVWTSSGIDTWSFACRPDPRISGVVSLKWKETPWAYFTTCNSSVRRDDLTKAGLFDETFVGWGFEDSELAYRLYHHGVTFSILANVVPFHLDEEQDSCKENDSYRLPDDKLSSYIENGKRFMAKYVDDLKLRELITEDRLVRMLANGGMIP